MGCDWSLHSIPSGATSVSTHQLVAACKAWPVLSWPLLCLLCLLCTDICLLCLLCLLCRDDMMSPTGVASPVAGGKICPRRCRRCRGC